MKVSSRVDYALSCVLIVADKYAEHKPATVNEIAEREHVESDYVEQLCVMMKKAGILKSIRGKNGGYVLARPPLKITAKDVMAAIDKNVLETVCSRKKGRRKRCIHFKNCNIRFLWNGLGKDMELFLDRHTLNSLLRLRRTEKNW